MKKNDIEKNIFKYITFFMGMFILVFIIAYFYISRVLIREVELSNKNALVQSAGAVDYRLETVDKVSLNILNDSTIIGFLGKDSKMYDMVEYVSMQRIMNSYINMHDCIDSVYVYSQNKNRILTNLMLYKSEDFFDRDILNVYNELKSKMLWLGEREIDDGENRRQVLSFIRLYSSNKESAYKGAVVINIKVSDLSEKVDFRDKMQFYIISKDSYIWCDKSTSSNEDKAEIAKQLSNQQEIKKINGKTVNVYYRNSDYNAWTYCLVMPNMQELRVVLPSLLIIGIMAVLFFVIMYLYILRMNKKTIKPINRFINSMQDYCELIGNDTDSVESLEDLYQGVLKNHIEQNKYISDTVPLLKADILRDIIMGREKNLLNAEAELLGINIKLYNDGYMVMLIKPIFDKNVNQKDECFIWDTVLKCVEHNLQFAGVKCVASKCNENNVSVLISVSDVSIEADVRSVAEKILNDFLKIMNVSISIGIGGIYNAFSDINKSYVEADKALEYSYIMGINKVISFEDIYLCNENTYDKIGKLVGSLESMSIKAMQRSVEDIFQIIKNEGVVPYRAKKILSQVFIEVLSIMGENKNTKKILGNISFDEIYNTTESFETIEDAEKCMEKLFVCVQTVGVKKESTDKLIEAIQLYIADNYMKNGISVEDIAKGVNYSKTYISQYFKVKTGKGIMSYLIDIRMKRAKEILVSSDEKISTIAEMVGYTDTRAFIRTFKKTVGMTPTEYRTLNN